MKIAIVHNRNKDGVICRFGTPCAEQYSAKHVNLVAQSLHQAGHVVWILEADKRLLGNLEALMPPTPYGAPTGMVFNMAYGIQGNARYTHLPAMLEMAGIPYTGSTPLGHGLSLDKVVTKMLLRQAGIPTPNFAVLGKGDSHGLDLRFPLIVKPRNESTSYGLRLVKTPAELTDAIGHIVDRYQQEALVEEYIDGREVCIGLLGNEPVETLPPVELDFRGRGLRLMTYEDKYHKRTDEPRKICPAKFDPQQLRYINEIARKTFQTCHVLDYGRVDIRISKSGEPYVLEINSMASLGTGGSYMFAAKASGRTFDDLIQEIVQHTARRSGMLDRHEDKAPVPASIAMPNILRHPNLRAAAD